MIDFFESYPIATVEHFYPDLSLQASDVQVHRAYGEEMDVLLMGSSDTGDIPDSDEFSGPDILVTGGRGGGGGFVWTVDNDRGPTVSVGGSNNNNDDNPTCIDSAPVGVNIQAINTVASRVADFIKAENWTNIEYSSFIFELNGQVEHTVLMSFNSADSTPFDTRYLPNGAKVLALIHNQPDTAGDNRRPSADDWTAYDTLAEYIPSEMTRITFDPNALQYILTNEDNSLRAYDKDDRNRTNCDI